METIHHADSITAGTDFIARLGYRELYQPRQFRCIRNGEPLELTVHTFENRSLSKVLYYTEALYIPSGKMRHTTLFHFNADSDHEALHKYCLHALFFDERIGAQFEKENRFTPPAHLDLEKAETFLNWVRVYWNSNYFSTRYKELGGLGNEADLLHLKNKTF